MQLSVFVTSLIVIKSKKLTGIDGGYGNYYKLVRGHRREKVGNVYLEHKPKYSVCDDRESKPHNRYLPFVT